MNKKLREMLDAINAKKAEVKKLVDEKKLEEAKAAKQELVDMQTEFDILLDLENEEEKEEKNQIKENMDNKNEQENKEGQLKAFVNAMKAAWKKEPVAEDDRKILNAMSEGSGEDGGLTVPKDAKTQIKELRRSEDALEPLVNVERVSTNSGTRVIERYADQTPFDNVEEAAEFPEVSTPQFDDIEYKIKKKGGILKVTRELLQDSAENIMGYLKKWISKKAKATRNFMIVAKIKEICSGLERTVSGIDDLKDIFNLVLDPAVAINSCVLTNQYGFNWLDKLKDKDGNYILQKDPTNATKKLLFGSYPVKVVSNKTLGNIKGKAPLICGDLKEAITIFDRETLTVDITDLAAGAWERDQTSIKVRERLDIQTVDAEAIVMGLVEVTDTDGSGKYSQEELDKLTKEEILSLASELGYAMATTKDNTKAEIIADFIAKQK